MEEFTYFCSMKRTIAAIFSAAAMLAACSQEDLSQSPQVSFISAEPEISSETAKFRIITRNDGSDKAVTIPVTFGGTAEKGTDYTASADAFIIGGESPVDSIVITALKLGTDKTVSLTLDLPAGFEAGWFKTSEYTLQDKYGYLSFRNGKALLADTLDISIQVTDRDGTIKSSAGNGIVNVRIDTEKSTAVEGTHFSFVETSEIGLVTGDSQKSIRIAALEENVQEGNDKIVLNITHGEKFDLGQVQELEITLLGRSWKALDGKWQMDTLITDSLYMENIWKDTCSALDSLPVFNESDAITFNLASSSASPSFRSAFGDYFIGSSNITKGELLDLDLGNGETASVQTFMFSNTNRYFSPDEESEDKESLVGFRMIADSETQEEMLDMYVIDYTSKTFMPELDSLGLYAAEKPVAAAPGFFLNAVFKKQ